LDSVLLGNTQQLCVMPNPTAALNFASNSSQLPRDILSSLFVKCCEEDHNVGTFWKLIDVGNIAACLILFIIQI